MEVRYNSDMIITPAIQIPKHQFSEPRKNLSNKSSRKNTERDFTLNFARAYVSKLLCLHHKTTHTEFTFAREIPVNGLGIADFVVISWDPRKFKRDNFIPDFNNCIKNNIPLIRAFELKISNWRRALLQAHRYKYYSDVAIIVIPTEKLQNAKQYINTFKAIKVGLWGFSSKTNQITSLYTPRPSKPFDEAKYKPRVIHIVTKASQSQRFL